MTRELAQKWGSQDWHWCSDVGNQCARRLPTHRATRSAPGIDRFHRDLGITCYLRILLWSGLFLLKIGMVNETLSTTGAYLEIRPFKEEIHDQQGPMWQMSLYKVRQQRFVHLEETATWGRSVMAVVCQLSHLVCLALLWCPQPSNANIESVWLIYMGERHSWELSSTRSFSCVYWCLHMLSLIRVPVHTGPPWCEIIILGFESCPAGSFGFLQSDNTMGKCALLLAYLMSSCCLHTWIDSGPGDGVYG